MLVTSYQSVWNVEKCASPKNNNKITAMTKQLCPAIVLGDMSSDGHVLLRIHKCVYKRLGMLYGDVWGSDRYVTNSADSIGESCNA
jgi:hypothetical protein